MGAATGASAQRRASVEQSARIVAPDHLGAATPANEAILYRDRGQDAGLPPLRPSTDPSVIAVWRRRRYRAGYGKVVRTLVEASKLQQGDIIIAR